MTLTRHVEPRRWSVTGLGALLGGFVLGVLALGPFEGSTLHVVQLGTPLLLAGVLTGVGVWIARSDLDTDRVGRIARWTVGGALVFGAFATLEMYTHLLEGESLFGAVHELLLGLTEGAVVGVLVGYYDARRKDQHLDAERARQAIDASMDGIAMLDEDGVYQVVNQAHAEVYGYDDPEAFVGETWHMCYTDEEVERVEAQVFSELNEEGRWRGELTGKRRDGSTYPQELTLSTRPNGGLVCVVRDITERREYERRLRALHDATREMMLETDREAICRTVVETAVESLDLEMTAIWLRADEGRRLVPVAWSDEVDDLIGEPPVFEPGSSISWEVYEEGEVRVFDDVSEVDARSNAVTDVRSELVVPIGDHGVLNTGATEPGRFDETDVVLARLLATNVRSSLDRADREAALERQTERMEFFNSILRHDVLNGVTVIRGRAEFLAEALEGQQREDAEAIIEWTDDVDAVIRRVRTVLDTLTGTDGPRLEPFDLSSTVRSEVDRIRSAYPEVEFETDVPDGVTVLANELLGEVVGNVVTNAIDHNDTGDLSVSVTVEDAETPEGSVAVRVADDGRGVPDELTEAIFRRGESGDATSTGSGFGLFFVDTMVSEYGGDVRVEDNDAGGATFVIELRPPSG